jgi:hypothetical protein
MSHEAADRQTSGILEGFPSPQPPVTPPHRPNRILNRRFDPLRRRTPDEWRRVFAAQRCSSTLICAARRVFWDYPASACVTDTFRDAYRRLSRLPSVADLEACLVRLGYHPIQAHRAAVGGDKRSPPTPPALRIPYGFRDSDDSTTPYDAEIPRTTQPLVRAPAPSLQPEASPESGPVSVSRPVLDNTPAPSRLPCPEASTAPRARCSRPRHAGTGGGASGVSCVGSHQPEPGPSIA